MNLSYKFLRKKYFSEIYLYCFNTLKFSFYKYCLNTSFLLKFSKKIEISSFCGHFLFIMIPLNKFGAPKLRPWFFLFFNSFLVKVFYCMQIIDSIQIKTVTWIKDSHGLFDYESRHLNMKKFISEKPCYIWKKGAFLLK